MPLDIENWLTRKTSTDRTMKPDRFYEFRSQTICNGSLRGNWTLQHQYYSLFWDGRQNRDLATNISFARITERNVRQAGSSYLDSGRIEVDLVIRNLSRDWYSRNNVCNSVADNSYSDIGQILTETRFLRCDDVIGSYDDSIGGNDKTISKKVIPSTDLHYSLAIESVDFSPSQKVLTICGRGEGEQTEGPSECNFHIVPPFDPMPNMACSTDECFKGLMFQGPKDSPRFPIALQE